MSDATHNVAGRLSAMARLRPDAVAVAEPSGRDAQGRRRYRQVTFQQLDLDSRRIAQGLRTMGVVPGTRLALLVRPGIDFVSLVFALFKSGAVAILIDPGMGRRSLIGCLAEAEPEGFVAIPAVHAVRKIIQRRFPKARLNVTVGRRWFWGGTTLAALRKLPSGGNQLTQVGGDDPAAIIFTTGSTGPPKGVLFSHANFDSQVGQIRELYDIRPGEIDVPCFPLFGLFNCAMGVTAVIPDMDPSRPARVDPANIIEAVRDWNATQAFGSPAVWDRVGRYCEARGEKMPTLRRVLSAGAPIPAEVLRRMMNCIHQEGNVYTPYGATESLPVASISAAEVLAETAEQTRRGAGVCVGRRFPRVRWKVIRVVDGPIHSLDEIEELPPGEIGELIVQGPMVTRRYVTRTESNAAAKIVDGADVWHRMGDSGYLDERGRFWFCGRVAHRVLTADGPMYPVRCEAIFNQHPKIRRSALVGVGPAGRQRPVIVLEPHAEHAPKGKEEREALLEEIRRLGAANPLTDRIADFLPHPAFPVDIRHNAKIFREKLAVWAEKRLGVGL
ncbi:MAG: AMP-binding protein [Planctomycetes bacterium]|nr:AMP-binding protein [Planctomycetota bacterium]MCG2684718.1 AMP-binding protein [Planctomycetales bacterium]